MTIRVSITHRIEDRFARAVSLPTQWLRLRPAPNTRADVTAYSLAIHTEPHFLNWLRDPFENHLARLDLPEPISSLRLELELLATLNPVNPFDFLVEPYAANHPFEYPEQLHKELEPYLYVPSSLGARTRAFLAELDGSERSTVELIDTLNQHVSAALTWVPTDSAGTSDLEAAFSRGAASSWELAWLLTLSLRHLGHAARMAAGYRVFLAEADSELEDSVNLHAWSEVFLPGAGWIGLDPTMGLFTSENYIPFACAPDPSRVVPGVGLRGAGATHSESLRVRRLVPRADSFPFSATQWSDIRGLGELVERDLAAQGAALSVGPSLSFVSAVHANEAEWNTTALGSSKRFAADALLERLMPRFAPFGVPQLGQGEWFAGDSLPRWRLACFYRSDGEPVWRNRECLGWGKPGAQQREAAEALAHGVAQALGVARAHVLSAHEDALYERMHAAPHGGGLPSAAELRDPAARRGLADRLSRSDRPPVGYVLPLRWDYQGERFVSGPWPFRRERLYLLPGQSPLGYRLPLDSLMVDKQVAFESQLERDPFAPQDALPDFHAPARARLAADSTDPGVTGMLPPRTALCVEARGGQLYVFVPPVSDVAHYLTLVAAVESAAEALELTVILEGYEPPEDPRLLRLALEPDPAVLRVQLPLLATWSEQVEALQSVYEQAALVGLRAERVMIDGRRMPSSGGGPLTVGGSSPADSPFLNRPEVLRGLIAYWQRHPSLSYFFAGHGIGGSSATPRADAGRDEALYELSIGLSRLPSGPDAAPWMADRALRHLLTDPAGDMKRAEIRTDRLFAPERASKRLGQVVIHAFETAPDPQLQALQHLLVQGLVGRFARIPDSGELTRWGSALADRFLLPRVLWEDLRSVVRDLNEAGYPFQLEWFEPFMALRFLSLGAVAIGEITLELSSALEPWPVLAEEIGGGGMARFIDTANERLQVGLKGLTPGRYALICNGERVPLRQVGDLGEYVAGVRYKVVNPISTMHPTVFPVNALVFDLLDLWTGRVAGGCTYFPGRPEVWGPVGYPVAPPARSEPDTRGERPRPAVPLPEPSWATRPWSRPARFLPRGSGLDCLPEPPAREDERFYLLDLVHHG